jgi:CDP-diacylglycerol--glycerol-3-phosphate 3-phosphatidyltransferase
VTPGGPDPAARTGTPGVFAFWPNRITAMRFAGAALLFALLAIHGERPTDEAHGVLVLCFWLFIVTALTDVLDGWLARRNQEVTAFGRIADPFVDKVLILGALIFLAVLPWSRPFVPAWVVVVVLAREVLVTAIRGYVESIGRELPADWFGKLKMLAQSFAVGTILGLGAFGASVSPAVRDAAEVGAHVLVWGTLILSAGSGLSYVVKTRSALLGDSA